MGQFSVGGNMPDELAQRAERAGLLSDDAIRQLLEDAMRREAGRKLLEMSRRIQETSGEPMSDDEIVAIVKEVRAEQRKSRGPHGSQS